MSDIWQGRNNEGDIVVSPMNNGLFSYAYTENPTESFEIGAKELCDFFEPKNPKVGNSKEHGRKDDSQNIAASILQDALAAMSERGQSYDTTGDGKERSMAKVVQMFNTLTGSSMTTEQGWDFMILLKLTRASQGYKHDNYIDGAAYFGLAGEAASEAADD